MLFYHHHQQVFTGEQIVSKNVEFASTCAVYDPVTLHLHWACLFAQDEEAAQRWRRDRDLCLNYLRRRAMSHDCQSHRSVYAVAKTASRGSEICRASVERDTHRRLEEAGVPPTGCHDRCA